MFGNETCLGCGEYPAFYRKLQFENEPLERGHLCKSCFEKAIETGYFDIDNTQFERIRRITGYLVGSVERFNDAKRSEEKERVKHGIETEVIKK